METITDKCFIWKTPAEVIPLSTDAYRVNSPRTGGIYTISGTASLTVGNLITDQAISLTSWLVRQRMMGVDEPRILSDFEPPITAPQVHQRADNLLQYIRLHLHTISATFDFNLYPYPEFNSYSWQRYAKMLAWSASTESDELAYLIGLLEKQAWLEAYRDDSHLNVRITADGHLHLAELAHGPVDSSQAFIAMWFDTSLDDAWNKGIGPAVRESGYTAMRIDQKDHINKIDDEIIAEIRRSKFLIADLTEGDAGTRGSVYYEAGFAHGLGIPVIFTCREDSLEKVHFDIRQYPLILWGNPEDLKPRLAQRISAVLGDGPQKRNP